MKAQLTQSLHKIYMEFTIHGYNVLELVLRK